MALALRALTIEEEQFVAGGDGMITVTARYDQGGSGGGFGSTPRPDWARRGNTGDDTDYNPPEDMTAAGWQMEALRFIGGILAGLIGAEISQSLDQKNERQKNIAEQFHGSDAVASMTALDRNGEIVHGVQMRGGESFWDMDRDGKYDLHFMTDTVGNVYRDNGTGFEQVRGTG